MPVFPEIIKPMDDELLYSYLQRLVREYGETDYYRFLNHWFRGTQIQLKDNSQINRYDTAFNISNFLDTLLNIRTDNNYKNLIDAYLEHTIYSFCAPLWADYQKQDWILNQFRPMKDNSLVSHVHTDLVKPFRYCPVCMKEEQQNGLPRYYHLSHNLPGVNACRKHKVQLIPYTGKFGIEMDMELSSDITKCTDWEFRYAKFAYEFSMAKIPGNLNTTARVIRDRINESGQLEPAGLKSFMEEITGTDVDITAAQTALSLRKQAGEAQKRFNCEKTFSAIAALFTDTEDFQKYLNYESPKEQFMIQIEKRHYDLISNYNPHLVILKHDTCFPFVTTPELIVNGWGCPECEEKLTPAELFKSLLKIQKGDEYELLSDFETLKKPVTVRHNECGKIYNVQPVKLIKRGVPCSCHLDVNNRERAEKWLSDHYPQFKLLTFNDMNDKVTLLCRDCLNISTYPDFYYFMDHPRCRACQPVTYDRERIENLIRDLVGDEYTLVTFTNMQDESTVFRHNTCGKTFTCAPRRFIRGTRCPTCRYQMSLNELNTALQNKSSNRYQILIEESSRSLCSVKDNYTGEIKALNRVLIQQELIRPTPSSIFEFDEDDNPLNSASDKSIETLLEEYIKIHPAFLKDDFKNYCGNPENFDGIFTGLVIQRKIKEIHRLSGIYISNNSSMDLKEIIEKTLLHDSDGNRIGYWTGSSFLNSLGIAEEPNMYVLVSNRFMGRYKVHLTIYGKRIAVSGPQYGTVTNDNWKAMCLLSWTVGNTYTSDETVMDHIMSFISDASVNEEMIQKWSGKIHPRIFGRFKKIIETIKNAHKDE